MSDGRVVEVQEGEGVGRWFMTGSRLQAWCHLRVNMSVADAWLTLVVIEFSSEGQMLVSRDRAPAG